MKDAKGHGSNPRSGGTVNTVYSSKQGVGGLGKGMYAQLQSGQTVKLNPAATGGQIPGVGSTIDPSQHSVVGGSLAVASAHNIPTGHLAPQRVSTQGGPYKVQSLDTKLAGQPFKTTKSFRNRTVAEHVAKYMNIDGGYNRVKSR